MVDGIERMKFCECRDVKRMQRMIERSGVDNAFKDCAFDKFQPWDGRVAQAKGIAESYVLDFSKVESERQNSFALLGAVGSGKTTLGVCVLNALMKKGISVLYAPFRDMVHELKSNVLDDYAYDQAMQKYTKPRVLYIDDLYKGMTDKDPKYVYDIVNARYLAKKPLIVTSELPANHIVDVDSAVGSRIIEMCRAYIYELTGPNLNYRLRGC